MGLNPPDFRLGGYYLLYGFLRSGLGAKLNHFDSR
jgi:hypothetical protein